MLDRLKRFWILLLGVFVLAAPFLYLQLVPNFENGTIQSVSGWDYAAFFFTAALASVAVLASLFLILDEARQKRSLGERETKKAEAIETSSKKPFLISFFTSLSLFLSKRWVLWGMILFLFLLGLFLPRQGIALDIAIRLGICMILSVALNIAVGWAGLLVLGYAAFYAMGGYVFALSAKYIGWNPWWAALLPAFILGASLGWLMGLPCLKLRGDYLAIVTLGFAEALRELTRNLSTITGGDKGLSVPLHAKFKAIGGLISHSQMAYMMVLLILIVTIVICSRIYRSSIGRAWEAIRQDETAANAVGIGVVRMKLLAFMLSAGLAAIAGVLQTAYIGFIDPTAASLEQSILIFAMVILGGLGRIEGALLGSAILFILPELLRAYVPQLSDYRLFFFGLVMVLVMLLRPQGIFSWTRERK